MNADNHYSEPECPAGDIEKCDLAAQQSMAESTREMGYAAWITLLLTGLGVFLIWRTLVYTARTLDEAKVTAQAALGTVVEAEKTTAEAKRQADLQEEAFRRLERPYLFVKIGNSNMDATHPANYPALNYNVINSGKTPAVLRSIYTELLPVKKFPLRVPLDSRDLMYEVIEPGDVLPENLWVKVKWAKMGQRYRGRTKTRLVFHGLITYEDALGVIYRDRFCFRKTKAAVGTLKAAQNTTTAKQYCLNAVMARGNS